MFEIVIFAKDYFFLQENLSLFLTKMKVSNRMKRKIYKRIFVGEKSIIESKDENEYEERKIDFELRFGDDFKGTYLTKYFQKLLENVKKPNWISKGAIPTSQTNNGTDSISKIMTTGCIKFNLPNLFNTYWIYLIPFSTLNFDKKGHPSCNLQIICNA